MLETIPAIEHADILHDESEKRVGVYVRVSTDDPRQTSSFELQRNHYTDLIDRYPNWHLYRIYADEGISGTSLKHRKAFLEMIEDCKQHKLDLIVTKSVSRFARNIYHCIGYVRELAALKPPVGVLFETEGLYTLKDDSEMALSFTATFAQEESRTRSSAMNLSYEMRFRRGIFMLPELLGYDKDEDGQLVINEDELRLSASDWRHATCAIVLPLLCRDDRASLWNRKSCPYLTLIPEMAQYPFHILIPETSRRWNTAQLLDQRFNLSHCTLAKVTVIWLQSIILRGASWSTQTYLPPAEPKRADLYLIQRAHSSTILVHTFSGHQEKDMNF